MSRTDGGQKRDRGGTAVERPTQQPPRRTATQSRERTADRAAVCPGCGYAVAGTPYCANCGLRVTSARPDLPVARRRTREVSTGARTGRLAFVALVALVALAAGVTGLVVNRPRSDAPIRSQVDRLQSALAHTDHQLASEKAAIAGLQAASRNGTLARLRTKMHQVATCVPELTAYVNGLLATGPWVRDRPGNHLVK